MRSVDVSTVKSRRFGPKPQSSCASLLSFTVSLKNHMIQRRHEFGRFSLDLVPSQTMECSACSDTATVPLTTAVSRLADSRATSRTTLVGTVDVRRRRRVDYSLMYVGGRSNNG